jgi:hypothetical protein
VRQVSVTYALRSQSLDLPNIITAVNSIRDTAVLFEVALSRNWRGLILNYRMIPAGVVVKLFGVFCL